MSLFDFGGSEQQGAGFLVQESDFRLFDFNGKADPQTCWHLKLFSPKSGKVFDKYLPAGRECTPNADGTGVDGQLWRNSLAAKVLASLVTDPKNDGPFITSEKKPIKGAGVDQKAIENEGVGYFVGGTLFVSFDGFDTAYTKKAAALVPFGFIPDAQKVDAAINPLIDDEAKALLEELPGDVTKAQIPGLLMKKLNEKGVNSQDKTRLITRAMALFGGA